MKTTLERRSFLKSATLTTLSAGVVLGAGASVFGQRPRQPDRVRSIHDADFPVPIGAQRNALFFYRQESFTPYVGDTFQVPNALGRMVSLTLVSVTPYSTQPNTRIAYTKTRQPVSFSLSFTSDGRLPQFTSIHKVSHPALGEFDLFLTSREIEGGMYLHEAVFNHIQ